MSYTPTQAPDDRPTHTALAAVLVALFPFCFCFIWHSFCFLLQSNWPVGMQLQLSVCDRQLPACFSKALLLIQPVVHSGLHCIMSVAFRTIQNLIPVVDKAIFCHCCQIRLVALGAHRPGFLGGRRLADLWCSRAARRHMLRGMYRGFLASKKIALKDLIGRRFWNLPVVNLAVRKHQLFERCEAFGWSVMHCLSFLSAGTAIVSIMGLTV